MKRFIFIGLMIANLGYASSIPWSSYKCTSTAKFYEKNTLLKTDNQIAIAGYVGNSNVGMMPFLHTYNNYKIHTGISIAVGSYTGSDEEHTEAWYFHLPNLTFGTKPTGSSRFEAIEAELPEKFALTLDSASLAVDLRVNLRVVCKKQ